MDTARYLVDSELSALLAVPDRSTTRGRGDYALLLLLSQTCSRLGEVTRLRIGDFALTSRESNWIQIGGNRQGTSFTAVVDYR
jgi:integrase